MILGARDERHELVLDAFEKELEQERNERKKNGTGSSEETVKEEAR